MAGPATTVAIQVLKKVSISLLSEPEKLVKFLIYGVVVPFLAVVLVLFLPAILLFNVPLILLDGNSSAELTAEQLKVIAIYQNAPVQINKENLKWIETKKSEFSGYNDIQVKYDYDLTWQHLLAIDTVRLKQDFKNVNPNEVLDIGRDFIKKSTYTETYKEIETYEVEVPYFTIEMVSGKLTQVEHTKIVVKSREVTRKRAVIVLSTVDLNTVMSQLNFDTQMKEMSTRMYATIQGVDVEGNLNLYDDVDVSNLKEYPPGNASIPYFNQGDKRWGALSYGNSNIKSGGCGPTSLSMVIAGLTKRGDINPKTVADWAYANGHRAEGLGSYWSIMSAGAKNYGVNVENVSRRNPDKIIRALSNGYPVIVAMGRGHFTNGGHFIVLRGITNSGKILVYDPASLKRTQQEWEFGIIMNESSTNAGSNGSPFWIFK